LEIARNNLILDEDWVDASGYAAYVLGKIGTMDDVAKLKEYYDFINKLYYKYSIHDMVRQAVSDSIEMIQFRENKLI